jgi:hypothetical protein
VIIRYLETDRAKAGFSVTGGTTSTGSGYTYHTFTSSGSLVVA